MVHYWWLAIVLGDVLVMLLFDQTRFQNTVLFASSLSCTLFWYLGEIRSELKKLNKPK